MGHLAALFLGQDVRPVILLDADEAGRVRRDSLLKELYVGQESHIVMLDDALQQPGTSVEIEDILGTDVILPILNSFLSKPVLLSNAKDKTGSVPDRIKSFAKDKGITLPDGWKTTVALQLVSTWSQQGVALPDTVLEKASHLFAVLNERFATQELVRVPTLLREKITPPGA